MQCVVYPWEDAMKQVVINGIAPVEELRLRGTMGELLGRVRFRWWTQWRKRVDFLANKVTVPVYKHGMPALVELYKHRKLVFMIAAERLGLTCAVNAYDTVELIVTIESRRLVDLLAVKR